MMERVSALNDPADPLFANFFDGLIEGGKEKRIILMCNYPLLSALCNKVIDMPEINKWMTNRPSSQEEVY